MKKEDLLQAMQGIADEDIENSEKKVPIHRRYRGLEMLAACACLLLIVGVVCQWKRPGSYRKSGESMSQTEMIQEDMEGAQMEEEEYPVDEREKTAYTFEESGTDYTLTWKAAESYEEIAESVPEDAREEWAEIAGFEGKVTEYKNDAQESIIVCQWYNAQEKKMYCLKAKGVDRETILSVAEKICHEKTAE